MSKHGLFTDTWYPCPYCGAEIGVTLEKEEYLCAICSRRWTIYNFPPGIEGLFYQEIGEGDNETSEEGT